MRVVILVAGGKRLHDHVISQRVGVEAGAGEHKTNLTPSQFHGSACTKPVMYIRVRSSN